MISGDIRPRPGRISYIIRKIKPDGSMDYQHIIKLFQTDKFIKFRNVDNGSVQIMPIDKFERKYIIEETVHL